MFTLQDQKPHTRESPVIRILLSSNSVSSLRSGHQWSLSQTSSDRNLCQTHSVNAREMANKTVKKLIIIYNNALILEAIIFKYERSNCLIWKIWYKHPTLVSMGTMQ